MGGFPPEVKTTPIPVRAMVCGLPAALSRMTRVPELAPAPSGVRVTEIAQSLPACTMAPQLLVWEKSPLTEMLEMASAPLPVSVTVMVWALLLDPTG